jgi:hypothetical protein
MTQRKEHSWSEWDYENRFTSVWVMMLTSASCCWHVQQDSACSFSVHQDSDISTQGTAPVYVIDMIEEQINREDADTCYFGVRTRVWIMNEVRLLLLSHVLMLVLRQLVCGRPMAWTVFAHSNTGIMCSNPTRGMDVCVRLFCVCVVLCLGSGLVTGSSLVQGVLRTVYGLRNWKSGQGPTKDCRAIDIFHVGFSAFELVSYNEMGRHTVWICWRLQRELLAPLNYSVGRNRKT